MKTKNFIITLLFIAALLIIASIFPIKDIFQDFVSTMIFLTIVPLLYNKIILKRNMVSVGLQVGEWREGLKWCLISIVPIVLIYIVSKYFFGLIRGYAGNGFIGNGFWEYMVYELVMAFFIVFVYDLFFRGFVMFILEKKIGQWAIVAQAVIFVVYVLMAGIFDWRIFPFLVFSPFAGMIAYKSRSIFYSAALQIIILIIFDAYVIHIIK
jgi:hypothetical protein